MYWLILKLCSPRLIGSLRSKAFKAFVSIDEALAASDAGLSRPDRARNFPTRSCPPPRLASCWFPSMQPVSALSPGVERNIGLVIGRMKTSAVFDLGK
jgi:hypothetical protein